MLKVKSGLILMAVGIGLNLLGRILPVGAITSSSPIPAALLALLMVGSVVIALFGLFRLIVGLLTRKKAEPAADVPPAEDVWPPAPKPPDAV